MIEKVMIKFKQIFYEFLKNLAELLTLFKLYLNVLVIDLTGRYGDKNGSLTKKYSLEL